MPRDMPDSDRPLERTRRAFQSVMPFCFRRTLGDSQTTHGLRRRIAMSGVRFIASMQRQDVGDAITEMLLGQRV